MVLSHSGTQVYYHSGIQCELSQCNTLTPHPLFSVSTQIVGRRARSTELYPAAHGGAGRAERGLFVVVVPAGGTRGVVPGS